MTYDASTPYADEPDEVRRSGYAVASLGLGLAAFFTCFVTGIPALILGIVALVKIDRSRGRLGGRGLAIAGIALGTILTLATCVLPALLLPAIQAAREAARRSLTVTNMEQIGGALNAYAEATGALPLAGAEDAQKPELRLSWRVRILPQLGYESLYEEFHHDEPWDSPHNRQLIEEMPPVFHSPNLDAAVTEGRTVYLAVVPAPGAADVRTALHPTEPTPLSALDEQRGETILLVEADADQAVPWTKPDDWELDPDQPQRGLGQLRPGGFVALYADGQVGFVGETTAEGLLEAFLLRD